MPWSGAARFGTPRFNGAALVRVRKSSSPPAPWSARCGFNGAALVRVRKLAKYLPHGTTFKMLQWGRTRSSAEILDLERAIVLAQHASMGPHSFECGNFQARGWTWWEPTLQWGRTRSSAEMPFKLARQRHVSPASMGPHSFECGNLRVIGEPGVGVYSFNGAALVRVRKYSGICLDQGR